MDNNFDYDLVVIGAGPGGYVAAIRASQLGLKTAIVEKDKPGGVCLNIGCIPSKSLIHQAEIFLKIKDLEYMGVKCDKENFNYKKVFKKSRKASDTLSKGVKFLMKKNQIEYIEGEAKILKEHTVSVNDKFNITAKNIIIATGASPRGIPGFEIDEEKIISSNGALMLESLPKSIIILGGGVIGMEIGYIMSAFGVEVQVVEMMDRILPMEDHETSSVVERIFKRRGVKFYTSTRAKSVEKGNNGKLILKVLDPQGDEKFLEAHMLLVSIGRAPNSKNIGLKNIGITTEKGFVPTGDYYQTQVPSVYAIGDVINTPQLAHVASKEGEIAVEHIAGLNPIKRIDPLKIPGAVYSNPQIGSFGFNEEELIKNNINYEKRVFPYRGAGKTVAIEESDGLVKVLYEPELKELLGVHIVGADASEIIHEALLAKDAELLPQDIAEMIHAHPTISEALMEVMRAVEGWAIHA